MHVYTGTKSVPAVAIKDATKLNQFSFGCCLIKHVKSNLKKKAFHLIYSKSLKTMTTWFGGQTKRI